MVLSAADSPLGGIGFYPELMQVAREVSAPISERRLVDVQSFAALALALIQASEKVCELGARKSHALTVVGARAKQQVLDFTVVEGLEPSTSAL